MLTSLTTRATHLDVTRVTDELGFDALRSEWNAAVDQIEYPSPFQSWEWNRTWWKYFGAQDKLEILVFTASGRVVGIAPLYRRIHRAGLLEISSLMPIGGTKHELTEQWEFLFPPRWRAQLFEALGEWLMRSQWSVIRIPGLRESDQLPRWLAHRAVDRVIVPLQARALPDTWEAFLGSLNKRMRDNIQYYPRLLRRHGHAYDCAVVSTPEAVRRSLPMFLQLHRARAECRVRLRHHDKFSSPERQAFLAEVAPLLAARAQLRIHLLRIDGQSVAAEMWMERGDTTFGYRSGYAPEWAKYSVAMVNTSEAIKDSIGRGMRRLDLLRGSGQFKERWGTRPRYRTDLIVGRHPRAVKALLRTRDFHRRLVSSWRAA